MSSLRARLKAGEAVAGVLSTGTDPSQAEFLTLLGFDFVMADAEHGAIDPAAFGSIARATRARGGAAMVRTPGRDRHTVARYLDAGATGVMAPFIDDPHGATDLVSAALYPPQGRRGVAGTPATDFGLGDGLPRAIANVNETLLVAAQVETRASVASVADICSVERLDVIFIGPADLSVDLGDPLNFETNTFRTAVAAVAAATHRSGKALGMLVSHPTHIVMCKTLGVRFFAVYTDALLGAGAMLFLPSLRS